MFVPECRRQFSVAGEQQAEIVQRAIVFVVFGGDAVDRRLDAQVDVLGHQHDRHVLVLLAQRNDGGEDQIVRNLAFFPGGSRLGLLRLEVEAADLGAAVELQPLRQAQVEALFDAPAVDVLDQFVDEAADLARVARHFRRAFFRRVEFLQHGHRQEYVVLLETEQGGRIVHEHVGVEYVDALASGHAMVTVWEIAGGRSAPFGTA